MNRQEWLEWRRQGVGASDAPIIMKVETPWKQKTWLDLYNDKVFGSEEFTSPAIERGKALESVVLHLLEDLHGIKLEPRNVDNGEIWRASLDGISACHQIFEIKCPNKKSHAIARSGKVPDYYYPQLQHQLMVTGMDYLTYVSYDGEELVQVRVERDNEYIKELKLKEFAFWDLVQNKTPPEEEKKYVDMHTNELWEDKAQRFRAIDASIKAMEIDKEALRAEFIELAGDNNCKGWNVRVNRIDQEGRMNYRGAYDALVKQCKALGVIPQEESEFKGKPSVQFRVEVY